MPCYVTDSFYGIELPAHKMYAVSYEPFWQKVRYECSLLDDEYIRTLALLESYVGRSPTVYETQCRLFRVYNYLNAAPLGQTAEGGWRKIRRHVAVQITTSRKGYKERLLLAGKPESWDWHTSRLAMQEMWTTDEGEKFLLFIHWKLKAQRLGRPTPKPELRYFLKLIEETCSNE